MELNEKKKIFNAVMTAVGRQVSHALDEAFAGRHTSETAPFAGDEEFPGELERITKEVTGDGEKITIRYRFGKNGTGISRELIAIGKDIYEYSKDYYLTLGEPYFDSLDDVYDFTVTGYRFDKENDWLPLQRKKHGINEGAWGFGPTNSDDYWDRTHDVTKRLVDDLIAGLKPKKREPEWIGMQRRYSYMGIVNGFLSADDIWEEAIHKKAIELYKAYEQAFNDLNADEENLNGWTDFKKYKKELRKTFDDFKKTMKTKFDFEIDEAIAKKERFDKLRKEGKLDKWGVPIGDYADEVYAKMAEDEPAPKKDKGNKKKPAPKGLTESLNFKPFHIPCYEGSDWTIPDWAREYCKYTTRDLPDGCYRAKYYAHMLEMPNGEKFYCPVGIRRSERMCGFEDWCVCDGQLMHAEHSETDYVQDNINFKPYHLAQYDGVNWEIPEYLKSHCVATTMDMKDGVYRGYWYANIFELPNGICFYCPAGLLRSRELTSIDEYVIYNGQIMKADNCDFMDEFDAEMWEAEHDYRIPEEIQDNVVGTIKDLEGVYRCLYYACYYEMENGDKYYSPIGVRHTRKCARWQNYRFHNGEVTEV